MVSPERMVREFCLEVQRKVGRKSLMRVWMSSLCFLELLMPLGCTTHPRIQED